MKKNIGSVDKIVRLVIAAIISILYLTGIISGTLGAVLLIVAAVLLLTSALNFCGLYALFGANTCPAKKE
ncbi:MAG: DUF2892 domain-containing protein [Bacteroidales bacterium]|jgi:hypothetical protein|nr:DUF2892 domain-containing protein [Bacteroidales bacterium]